MLCFESRKQRRISSQLDVCETTRSSLKELTERYESLKNRCSGFSEKLQAAHDHQKEFNDLLQKVEGFIVDTEARVNRFEEGKVSGDPAQLEKQLVDVKSLGAEIIAQGQQVERLKKAARDLTESLSHLGTDEKNREAIDSQVLTTGERLASLAAKNVSVANRLQTAVVQSQGIMEGIEGSLKWVRDVENSLKVARPISLDEEQLDRQVQECQLLKTDIDGHSPSIAALNSAAGEVIRSCTDPRKADEMKDLLESLNSRFGRVKEACQTRETGLQSVLEKMSDFQDAARKHNEWLTPIFDVLESKERVPAQTLEELSKEMQQREQQVQEMQNMVKELVENPGTADVGKVRDAFADVFQNWNDFRAVLSTREKEEKACGEKGCRFELLRAAVVEWLVEKETQADRMEPAFVEVVAIQSQLQQLKVCHYYSHLKLFD